MAEQLTLDIAPRPAMGRDDFFVSEANAGALAMIEAWRDWPEGKLVLVGEAGAGKTHLAHVWAAQSGARIVAAGACAAIDLAALPAALAVEGADTIAGDRAAEEALFHLHNACAHGNVPLLIAARSAPSRWGLGLPDLASRMAQAGLARLDPPDDQLLTMVLAKQATDRGVKLTPRMLAEILPRMPRSFAAARAVIARIDALALQRKVPHNLAHVRRALSQFELDPTAPDPLPKV